MASLTYTTPIKRMYESSPHSYSQNRLALALSRPLAHSHDMQESSSPSHGREISAPSHGRNQAPMAAETSSSLPQYARINPIFSCLATYIPHIDVLFVEGTKERY